MKANERRAEVLAWAAENWLRLAAQMDAERHEAQRVEAFERRVEAVVTPKRARP